MKRNNIWYSYIILTTNNLFNDQLRFPKFPEFSLLLNILHQEKFEFVKVHYFYNIF